jgi:hypothetical protein
LLEDLGTASGTYKKVIGFEDFDPEKTFFISDYVAIVCKAQYQTLSDCLKNTIKSNLKEKIDFNSL